MKFILLHEKCILNFMQNFQHSCKTTLKRLNRVATQGGKSWALAGQNSEIRQNSQKNVYFYFFYFFLLSKCRDMPEIHQTRLKSIFYLFSILYIFVIFFSISILIFNGLIFFFNSNTLNFFWALLAQQI